MKISEVDAGTISVGTLADGRLSGNVALLDGNQSYGGTNEFVGEVSYNFV